MTDTFSTRKRSEIMRAVKSQETRIEVSFRKSLWHAGFRYRKNPKKYFGKPDIVLKKYKKVIFIDSCFWHGCPKHLRVPKSNKKFWEDKISRNIERDKEVTRYYKKQKWTIIRIWEHEINKDELLKKKIEKVSKQILEDSSRKPK